MPVVLRISVMTLFVLGATAGHAEDKQAARNAYRAGVHHYDFGEYREALAAFKTAYQNFEDPSFLFNIAQCHRQLLEREEAIRVYRSYLRNAPSAANAGEVRELITRLERELSEEKIGRASCRERV